MGTCWEKIPKTYFSWTTWHLRADTRKSNGHLDSLLPGVADTPILSARCALRLVGRIYSARVGITRGFFFPFFISLSCSFFFPSLPPLSCFRSRSRFSLLPLSFSSLASSQLPLLYPFSHLQCSVACSVANSCEFGLIGPSRLSDENARAPRAMPQALLSRGRDWPTEQWSGRWGNTQCESSNGQKGTGNRDPCKWRPSLPLFQQNSLRIIYASLSCINLFIPHEVLICGVKYIQCEKDSIGYIKGHSLHFNAFFCYTVYTEYNVKM